MLLHCNRSLNFGVIIFIIIKFYLLVKEMKQTGTILLEEGLIKSNFKNIFLDLDKGTSINRNFQQTGILSTVILPSANRQ